MIMNSNYFLPIVPSAPRNVQYINLSSSAIELMWEPPVDVNGLFQRYIIMYTRQEQQISVNVTLNTADVTVTRINVTGLEEYEQYTVVVYGETDAGVGPGSDPLDVLTDQGGESNIQSIITMCFYLPSYLQLPQHH